MICFSVNKNWQCELHSLDSLPFRIGYTDNYMVFVISHSGPGLHCYTQAYAQILTPVLELLCYHHVQVQMNVPVPGLRSCRDDVTHINFQAPPLQCCRDTLAKINVPVLQVHCYHRAYVQTYAPVPRHDANTQTNTPGPGVDCCPHCVDGLVLRRPP